MPKKKSESREFTRSPVRVRTQVRLASGVLLEGQARDVSLKGILFATERALPKGTAVRVAMVLAIGGQELRIETEGAVARVGEGAVAIEFTQIDSESVEHLRNLVLYNAPDTDQVEKEFAEHVGLRPR